MRARHSRKHSLERQHAEQPVGARRQPARTQPKKTRLASNVMHLGRKYCNRLEHHPSERRIDSLVTVASPTQWCMLVFFVYDRLVQIFLGLYGIREVKYPWSPASHGSFFYTRAYRRTTSALLPRMCADKRLNLSTRSRLPLFSLRSDPGRNQSIQRPMAWRPSPMA